MRAQTQNRVDDYYLIGTNVMEKRHCNEMPIIGVTERDDYLSAIDKTLNAMIYHYNKKTDFDYYFIGDDDTFVNLKNYDVIISELSEMSDILFIGGSTGVINNDGRIHVTGGPGIIMNKKTFDTITPFIQQHYITHNQYSDVSLALNIHAYNDVNVKPIRFIELPEFLNPHLRLVDINKIATYHVRDYLPFTELSNSLK